MQITHHSNNTQYWVKSPILIKDACGKLPQEQFPAVKKSIIKHLGLAHKPTNTINSRWSNLLNGKKAVSPIEKQFIQDTLREHNIETQWEGIYLKPIET